MMNSTKMYMNNNMGPTKFLVKHKNLLFRMQSKCTPKLSLCDFEGIWIASAFSRRRVLAFLFYFLNPAAIALFMSLHCSWDMNSAIRQMHSDFINE